MNIFEDLKERWMNWVLWSCRVLFLLSPTVVILPWGAESADEISQVILEQCRDGFPSDHTAKCVCHKQHMWRVHSVLCFYGRLALLLEAQSVWKDLALMINTAFEEGPSVISCRWAWVLGRWEQYALFIGDTK
jgi:hypothetical protein